MSGVPKRSHEEAGAHSSASKYPHEDGGSYPKLPSSLPTEYHHHPHPHSHPHPHPLSHSHVPYDMAQDSRLAKVTRTETRDGDRRSPLHSVYRMPTSSTNETHMDSHPIVSEMRLETRDSKDVRDLRAEGRDNRTEARELLYGEAKRDSQIAKGEKDASARFEGRGDDNKEMKYERENHNDQKGDMKMEKEGYGHLNWKESKEYHRGKRYSEPPSGNMDSWHITRGTSQALAEAGKEGSAPEERDYVEGHEAVGENKIDSKGEDRFKEKDRKRKEGKHRDWADRDKERSDRRSSMQVGNTTSETKEPAREEREAERWERERKDLKEKERLKEREKDHIKRDSWNGIEKDGTHSEKGLLDGSVRVPEQENPATDQKKQKDSENWKNAERDPRDRRRERDADTEGERPEKRSRCYDKESDDGCTEGEVAAEREKEIFSYGVQQRKRMLRPRGSPQVSNREPRFRSRAQDNEGSVSLFLVVDSIAIIFR